MESRWTCRRGSGDAWRWVALAALVGMPALASAPRFTSFDVPGGSETRAVGINNLGVVVGRYQGADGIDQGFLRKPDGTFRTLSAPGGVSGTWAQAINDWGDVVGVYFDADFAAHDFLLRDGKFTSIEVPGALETEVRSIDNLGRMSGNYVACTPDVCNATHPDPLEIGFVLDRTGFRTVFFPGTDSTDVWDLALGTLVGDWSALAGNVFGYVERRGKFTNVNPPDSSITSIRGINLEGTLVGLFGDADGNLDGFARVARGFIQIDFPGASATFANRINELGTITGAFADDVGEFHGFLVTGWENGSCRGAPQQD
jgi:uncharacterized membrane protein